MQSCLGVILCGGQSTRMGQEKYLLAYHSQPQYLHLYNLLQPFCKDVIVSCNESQSQFISKDYYAVIDDESIGKFGPLTGLLSVHRKHPEENLLVMGCDYPLINEAVIFQLIETFKKEKQTVVFLNNENIIEPLIALYHASTLKKLAEEHLNYHHSLRLFLEAQPTIKLKPQNQQHLKSYDFQEDFNSWGNK